MNILFDHLSASAHRNVRPVVNELGEVSELGGILEGYDFRDFNKGLFTSLSEEIRRFFTVPRNEVLAVEFLGEQNELDFNAIYPYGALTKKYLDGLDSKTLLKIDFILDRDGGADKNYRGIPIVAPSSLTEEMLCDCSLVVMHPFREPILMQNAVDFGFSNVLGLFSSIEMHDWWHKRRAKWLENLSIPAKVRNIVVTTNPNFSIMSESDFLDVFDLDETMILYMGNPSHYGSINKAYRAACMFQSFDLLLFTLSKCTPESIHVSTVHADNYIYMVLKSHFPDIKMSHEIYDWSLIYSNAFVEPMHSVSSALMFASRVGEICSLQSKDILISKRGGSRWDTLLNYFDANKEKYFTFFHNFYKTELKQKNDCDGGLVYAGPMPALKREEDWPIYKFSSFMREIFSDSRTNLTIYNSLHPGDGSADDVFSNELSDFSPKYHRRLDYKKLVEEMASYDYGWMCLNDLDYLRECPDVAYVYSARLIGYISSGIPVIVDDTWLASVELIQQYNAGVVLNITNRSVDSIVSEIVEKWDPTLHKKGVFEIQQHMEKSNERAILVLKSLVKES